MGVRRKSVRPDDLVKLAGCVHYLVEVVRTLLSFDDFPEGERVIKLATCESLAEEVFDRYQEADVPVNGESAT